MRAKGVAKRYRKESCFAQRQQEHVPNESASDHLADTIACVGGSWRFILGFLAFLAVWVVLNAWLLGHGHYHHYPFIFLNLILSMLAAIRESIIMMSQNRQAERDCIHAWQNYAVNPKAKIEIMALQEKIDKIHFQEIILLRGSDPRTYRTGRTHHSPRSRLRAGPMIDTIHHLFQHFNLLTVFIIFLTESKSLAILGGFLHINSAPFWATRCSSSLAATFQVPNR